VLVLSSMAFVLMATLYNIIDIAHVWSGAPFTYLGMTYAMWWLSLRRSVSQWRHLANHFALGMAVLCELVYWGISCSELRH